MSMELNKVDIIGRFTKDPEIREISEGRKVADFSIAVNTTWSKEKEEVAYIDCVAWGKLAETVEGYCKKGREILLSGRLQQDTWEKDGQKRSRIRVVANSISFGARPKDDQDEGSSSAPKRQREKASDRQEVKALF